MATPEEMAMERVTEANESYRIPQEPVTVVYTPLSFNEVLKKALGLED